jgi:5'-deoxynucleotidase YfbR-like HD superfamily hydrolase/nucleoside phosphorylase
MPNLASSACDVLVIVALAEEYRQKFEIAEATRVSSEFGLPLRHAVMATATGQTHVAFALLGEMGHDQSLNLTTQLLNTLKPRLVVNLGISGLVSDDWRLGDVVVGSASDNYLHRGKVPSGNPGEALRLADLQFGGSEFPTTYRLWKLLTGLFETDLFSWNKFVNDCVIDRYASIPHDVVRELLDAGFIRDDPFLAWGPLACGPVVSASREFKDFLKTRNRNFVAVDMESSGVVQAAHQHDTQPETLVIRGISDFGDERKSELDRIGAGVLRAWSMRNALRLFRTFLLHVDFGEELLAVPTRAVPKLREELIDHLHRTVNKEYLEYPYSDENVDVEAHTRLFSSVAQLSDGSEAGDVFAWITDKVWTSPIPNAVNVEGEAGTGKSVLLSVLYWHLWRSLTRDSTNPVPVYVNLHRYNRSSRAGRSVLLDESQTVAELKAHLQPLTDLIERFSDTRLLVIVDGYDTFARHRESLASALLEIIDPTQHRRVVGLRRDDPLGTSPRLGSPDMVVTLRPMPVDSPQYVEYIERFVAITLGFGASTRAQRVKAAVMTLQLPEVDLFTLTVLLFHGADGRGASSLAGILDGFCRDHLERALPGSPRVGLVDRAAATAFHLLYTEGWRPDDAPETPVFLDLVNRHPRVHDFLVAKHVISEILRVQSGDRGATQRISFVYPSSVNRFAKDLMKGSIPLQLQIMDAVQRTLDDPDAPIYAQAHLAYLAGRMTAPQAVRQAKTLLNDSRNRIVALAEGAANTPEERQYLLLARTIYISLAYLGDTQAQQDYILRLLSDSQWDDINRGFHLEYYQDQPYDPSEPLISTDLLEDCSRTFQHLYDTLLHERHPQSYEIDLHTFCSLAQHRHAVGKLSDADRALAREIIELALASSSIRTEELGKYIAMLQRHLAYPSFRIGHLFDDFYHIKFVKRAGWVARGLQEAESVADHMYGAYLIAMFLLPDTYLGDPAYSKQRIMQMLLIHDLAEARTGDFLPSQRNDAARSEEQKVFDEITVLGTYSGMAVLRDVAALWEEYRSGSSINAKVTKEMDKLENYVQLHVYRADGAVIDDFDSWAASLRKEVKTKPGQEVLDKLRAFYEDPTRAPEHGSLPPLRD